MTLDQLRIFTEASRTGSFTRAAHNLGLSQSAVSLSIAKLEREFAVALFHRAGRTVDVTPAGQLFFSRCERILAEIDQAVARLVAFRQFDQAVTILACSLNAYDQWMAPFATGPLDAGARSPVELMRGECEEVATWVMRGTADLGLTERQPSHRDLHYVEVFADKVTTVVSPAVAEELMGVREWPALVERVPLFFETGTELEAIVRRELQAHGLDHDRLSRGNAVLKSTGAVLSAAHTRKGASLVPWSAARDAVLAGRLTRLEAFEFPLKYWLFGHRDAPIDPIALLIQQQTGTP